MVGDAAAEDCDKPNVITADRGDNNNNNNSNNSNNSNNNNNSNSNPLSSAYVFLSYF